MDEGRVGAVRRQVAIALVGALAACSSDGGAPADGVESPCRALAALASPRVTARAIAHRPNAMLGRVFSGAGHTYVDDGATGVVRVGDDGSLGELAMPARSFISAAVTRTPGGQARLFAVEDGGDGALLRYTSSDGGLTFDPATETSLLALDGLPSSGRFVMLAFGPDGLLYVATSDGDVSSAQDPTTLYGKVLRLDVGGDAVASPPDNPFATTGGRPEVWALGIHQPLGLDVDPMTGFVWLADRNENAAHEIDRVTRGANLGWPIRVGSGCAPPSTTCAREGFVDPLVTLGTDEALGGTIAVHRGAASPMLAGQLLFTVSGSLRAVAAFGPSGPPQVTNLGVPGYASLGRSAQGEMLGTSLDEDLHRIDDEARAPLPSTLLATGCFDLQAPGGAPRGAIAYDVATPLWSDGAAKDRFVVLPPGQHARTIADGDVRLPVGTVAGKTFSVDGRRVETRLLVQQAQDDWVGYSYAWNENGTDADLVLGGRAAPLPGGKSWYFPSMTDCNACHTPAAGYTLGIEARQLDDAAKQKLGVASSASRFAPNDARAYLHANCSVCHRDGSATGIADLDLRFDTPLERTGLCAEPKAGALGIADARIVAPGAPERSVLVKRMRALDETRMPKLGTHVVDETGVALVEAWIRDLKSCP